MSDHNSLRFFDLISGVKSHDFWHKIHQREFRIELDVSSSTYVWDKVILMRIGSSFNLITWYPEILGERSENPVFLQTRDYTAAAIIHLVSR